MPRFNPATGEWEGLDPPGLPRNNTRPPQPANDYGASAIDMSGGGGFARRPRRQPWLSRANEAVTDIGNSLADFCDNWRDKLGTLITWLLYAAGALGLIGLALDGHWIAAIIVGLLLGAVYVSAAVVVATIAAWLIFIPVAVLRFIFYNIWTLLIAIGIAAAACYNAYAPTYSYTYSEPAPVEEITARPYYCHAWVLNVREQPDRNAAVIGTFEKGDAIAVTDLHATEDFAAIEYFGRTAYVSSKYISQNEPQ